MYVWYMHTYRVMKHEGGPLVGGMVWGGGGPLVVRNKLHWYAGKVHNMEWHRQEGLHGGRDAYKGSYIGGREAYNGSYIGGREAYKGSYMEGGMHICSIITSHLGLIVTGKQALDHTFINMNLFIPSLCKGKDGVEGWKGEGGHRSDGRRGKIEADSSRYCRCLDSYQFNCPLYQLMSDLIYPRFL